MVKWQGFFLSDHTEDANKHLKELSEPHTRKLMPEMTQADISEVLTHAYANHKRVRYQAGHMLNGFPEPIQTDLIEGMTHDTVVFENGRLSFEQLWWVQEVKA
jgi:hypothetical protein